jgi:hypothetical protein
MLVVVEVQVSLEDAMFVHQQWRWQPGSVDDLDGGFPCQL